MSIKQISIYGIILLTLVLPLISSASLNGTISNSPYGNLTINTTDKIIYFDDIIIKNFNITINGLRNSESTKDKLTFTITEINKNYTGSDLPVIISNTGSSIGSQVVIVSNLIGILNVTGSFSSNNVFGGNNAKSFLINGNSNPFTSDNNSIFFNGQLNNGLNTLNVNYFSVDNSPNGFCAVVTSGYSNFFSGIVILFSILAVGIIILIIYSLIKVVNGEELNFEFVDNAFENFPVKIVMISILAITILVWIIISVLGSLCSL